MFSLQMIIFHARQLNLKKLKQEMIDRCGGHIPTAMYNITAFLSSPHCYGERGVANMIELSTV